MDLKPHPVLAAELGQAAQRVDCSGVGRAGIGDHDQRLTPGALVFGHRKPSQGRRRHASRSAAAGRGGIAHSIGVLRRTLRDRRLLHLELAFTGFAMAEYGVWVVILVYAYQRGGASMAAVVAVAQLVPAGLLAPVLARAVDRGSPATALRRGYWWQCSALSATASLLVVGAPDLLVYAGAAIAASAVTTTRPAQAALTPKLVDPGEALTAVNLLSGRVDSASLLGGPALAGAMIALGGPAAAVAGFAALLGGAALVTAGVAQPGDGTLAADERRTELDRASGALRAMRAQPGLAAATAVLGIEYVVIGMLDVLVVVLAIRVLRLAAQAPRTSMPRWAAAR